jgi:hypothetical protein
MFLSLSPRSSSRQAPDLTVILTAHRLPSAFFFVLSNLTTRSPILPLARSLHQTTSVIVFRPTVPTFTSRYLFAPPTEVTHDECRPCKTTLRSSAGQLQPSSLNQGDETVAITRTMPSPKTSPPIRAVPPTLPLTRLLTTVHGITRHPPHTVSRHRRTKSVRFSRNQKLPKITCRRQSQS